MVNWNYPFYVLIPVRHTELSLTFLLRVMRVDNPAGLKVERWASVVPGNKGKLPHPLHLSAGGDAPLVSQRNIHARLHFLLIGSWYRSGAYRDSVGGISKVPPYDSSNPQLAMCSCAASYLPL